MSVLPSAQKGNVFSAKRHVGVFAVLAIIVAILSLAFLVSKKDLKDGFVEKFKQSTKEADFGGFDRNERYLSNFELYATAESKVNKFSPLSQNFLYLASAYKANHDPFYRTKALELASYLKANYREESSNVNLDLECLDSSCASIKYPQEVKKVLEIVDEAKFSEGTDYKGLIKGSLDAAALKSDNSEKFNAYLSAFQYLWLSYQKTPDSNIKTAGEKLLEYINSTFPDQLKRVKGLSGEDKFIFK